MPIFSARALWPARDRTPVLRLALALVVAPGLIAGLLTLAAFLVIGMTEATGEAVLRETARAAATLSALVFLFTMTFGLAGIAVLWSLAKRGMLAWALAGAGAGTLAGVLFGLLVMPGVQSALLVAFVLAGWSIFLLIRQIAGVRVAPRSPGGASVDGPADGSADRPADGPA